MASTPHDDDAYTRAGRYVLGMGILALTVLFSNGFRVVEHPQWFFGVHAPSAGALKLELAGFVLQGVVGLWLAITLVFEIRLWRRAAAFFWPLTLALYFAPLPTARDVVTLAPALAVAGLLMLELSRTLDRATREAD